ncbi:MAG: PTS system mannose/fructose/sorbose family transporter subunit IID [Faecalibacterium sp.]
MVSELFNAIYPGILSLALVLFMMWRIKKGNRPTQLIIGLLIFGLLGAFLGIF